MSRTEVVVTGIGATTPLGGDAASTWESMLAGRSGVTAIAQEWAERLPVRIAASMAVDPSTVIDRVKMRRLDRCEAAALIAAQEAWADSGMADAGLDSERLAVVVGSGIGGATTLLNQDDIL
jgi:3-oxoacyl-[acyl-carrier-protein] synthase II